MRWTSLLNLCIISASLVACGDKAMNNPHKKAAEDQPNVRYSSFSESPKTLDPARSYSSNEILFTAQIYEPIIQYHYLKRPYTLIPLTAKQIPKVTYLDKHHQPLAKDADDSQIAYSVYDIHLHSNILYQPHPAFAKNDNGEYVYHELGEDDADLYDDLNDFTELGTRELTAHDYVYQIKRLAHPELNSPIFGLMENYILGFSDYNKTLKKAYDVAVGKFGENFYFDLRQYPLPGTKVIDDHHYQIILKGKYPQFIYWLAMPFFAPVPWEADLFYSQPDMEEDNLTFDWHPVGTGPYMLTENNPNLQMIMSRNPHFHGETYPTKGSGADKEAGYLELAGQQIPFIDTYIFSLEKESIPRWNKFLQGYYDQSSIGSDSFDQAIRVDEAGNPQLTEEMANKGVRLQTSIHPSIYYMGFNMMDDVVGGNGERARKLRQAISIALDYEEYISIFLNGRGIAAQGPLPPGIFGYERGEAGINPVVYNWTDGKPKRKTMKDAKILLAEAGYPNGRDVKTGKPLVLNYDVTSSSGPDDKARFNWMRKQFDKLGIQLNVRATQYNRFQEKMRTGNAQIFSWGWMADYPDAENFLFLLYGPNGKVKTGGENAANYQNAEFDHLFNQMKNLPNGPARKAVIQEMLSLVRIDAPWIWGLHAKDFTLSHQWNIPAKSSGMANNVLKYQQQDPGLRSRLIEEWNKPIYWPIVSVIIILLLLLIPAFISYWRRTHRPQQKRIGDA